MFDWVSVETISTGLFIISLIVGGVIEYKRRGIKGALIGIMTTIQKQRFEPSKEAKESAKLIVAAVKEEWRKDSSLKKVKRIAEIIDGVYHSSIENINGKEDEE